MLSRMTYCVSDVPGLQTALDAKQDTLTTLNLPGFVAHELDFSASGGTVLVNDTAIPRFAVFHVNDPATGLAVFQNIGSRYADHFWWTNPCNCVDQLESRNNTVARDPSG